MDRSLLPRARRVALTAATMAALLGSLTVGVPLASAGSVIYVTTTDQSINEDAECSLQEAIYAANLDDNVAPDPTEPLDPTPVLDTACTAGSGADIIELPHGGVFTFADPISDYDNYVGPSATPIITSEIIIEGRGSRLQRNPLGRLTRAFVVGFGGDLDLREVHLKNFDIKGGNGDDGGGGGMGAGGAIYVDLGSLLVQWSTFEGNSATGGNGSFLNGTGAGGGGGMFGNGGDANGGGGGGVRGNGGSESDADLGGGGGGRVTSGVGAFDGLTGNAGLPCGGSGGQGGTVEAPGSDDGDDAECAGGGGGGGTDFSPIFADIFCGGAGGDGAYGGGGGGGGAEGSGGDGGFGGGGGGNGGDAGFGGGGGAAGWGCLAGRGQGGTFGGDGGENHADGGGGGAGLGGAVFGYLSDITISNSTFAFNSAVRGLNGGGTSRDGRGAGGAVFTVGGDLSIESSTFAGNEAITVTGGGGGAIVVYDPEGVEEASLRLRNSIVAGNGASECYTRGGVTTTGSARNVITDSTLNNLDNPACPGVFSSDDPGLQPLLKYAPGRTPTMAIPFDSVAVDNADPTTSPLDDQRGIARPQGAGPDIGAYEAAPTGPSTEIDLVPALPDGNSGWYVSAVGFAIGAIDPDGTVAETRCALDPASVPASFADLPAGQCAMVGASSDGNHAFYASSIDNDGNVEGTVAGVSFAIDRTAPTLDPFLNVTQIVAGQTGVVADPNGSDATSGLASQSCDPVDTTVPGLVTVDCTATDNAGNVGTGSVSFVVQYQVLGFFSPVPGSKWRAGQTVPVKVALGGASARVSDAVGRELARNCRVTFVVAGAQIKSPQCLKYDPATDQFIFNWKLAKQPLGAATISVVVSYPGSTVTTTISESIEIIR